MRVCLKLGTPKATRSYYWKVLLTCLLKNPRALHQVVSVMALYLHFGNFRDYVLGRLDTEITRLEKEGDPRLSKETLRILFPTPVPFSAG